MDAHFNVYKARYDDLNFHIAKIRRSRYVDSIDIFINLDDIMHTFHRPNVEKETELCGFMASTQMASGIMNVIAHYKRWASKLNIKSRVWCFYTSALTYKNAAHLQGYRTYAIESMAINNPSYRLLNDALRKAVPVAKNICDYVADVHMIESSYIEPSVIPLFLKNEGLANYDWSMLISRDMYDLQYAYRDKWIFVSPKGDNTRIVTRKDLWDYVADHEHIIREDHNIAMYHHDIFPLALAVSGSKWRSIPRLGRVGWKTIFGYMDKITERDSQSTAVMGTRLMEILRSRKIDPDAINANFMVCSIETQVKNINDITKAFLRDQIKYVTDHDNLAAINEVYFSKFPINMEFLTSSVEKRGPFAF